MMLCINLCLMCLLYGEVLSAPKDVPSMKELRDEGGYIEYRTEKGEVIEVIPNPDEVDTEDNGLYRRQCDCMCRNQSPKSFGSNYHCCNCPNDICFPAEATVRLHPDDVLQDMAGNDVITMADVKRGQMVLAVTTDGSLVYSEVRAFMKRNPSQNGIYHHLTTASGHVVRLSGSHLIYTSKERDGTRKTRYAEDVNIGDFVYVTQNGTLSPSQVTNVQLDIMKGVYVPLTTEGTIVVDDVMTSCYASFDHNVAHVFMTPLRWFPWLLDWSDGTGMPTYVRVVKDIGRWILPSSLHDKSPQILGFFQQWLTWAKN